jgi:hypothetical protein
VSAISAPTTSIPVRTYSAVWNPWSSAAALDFVIAV